MRINLSKATFSSIVGIGQKVKKAAKETGNTYIELNRGVNSVVEIDLTEIHKLIDFNSKEFQLYAPNLGLESLRETIAKEYFPTLINHCTEFPSDGNTKYIKDIVNSISITPGGMPALDLIIQTLNVENIYFPEFYWGSYSKMATIRNKQFSFYDTLNYFDISKLNESSCIFICDPNNPTGVKMDDHDLLDKIKEIANTGAIVIFDSPYRKLFYEDNFFEKIMHPNVIITESFSKWIGLPGARLGFIFSMNKELNDELNIRLLYEFNGVSSPSQILVNTILSTPQGKKAIKDFQEETVEHIYNNIEFLRQNNLLVDEIYNGEDPMGIFAIINKSEDFLFQHRIGAVGLDKFVYHNKDNWSSYSRICVSVRHELFVEFMKNIL
jgi:aspartate/methionine/tyrosine aminotransferase